MRHFSAQYILTNSGPPLKRGVVTAEDDGTIISIEDTSGELQEKHSLEFHNGIIIPGFVNCHCHLELSHMKGSLRKGTGLGGFIEQVRNTRSDNSERIISAAKAADSEMYSAGVNLCADVCNTSVTFNIKSESRIKYHNLLEVFGIDPARAEHRMAEIIKVSEIAGGMNLPFSIVPHSVYSLSLTLFRLLREKTIDNSITSIHFMETAAEVTYLENQDGPIMTSYRQSGLIPSRLDSVKTHVDTVLNEITPNGNLILVHNTFAGRETIRDLKKRENIFWCLCPNSNIYIEKAVPLVTLFKEEGCEIITGTDSLASNNKLSIIEELKTLQSYFPSVSLYEMIRWATLNGARALGEDDHFGRIVPGKRPGLLLIQNIDLINMKLLPGSFVTRLI